MGQGSCRCPSPQSHQVRRVVLTGGPGAGGASAVLEVVRKHLCEHVVVLPEAAGIVYGGGFPRRSSVAAPRRPLAIYHVQDQLESMALAEGAPALVLCDRGVLDGLAYWPGEADQFFEATGTERSEVFGRYASVIHLRTPTATAGYDGQTRCGWSRPTRPR